MTAYPQFSIGSKGRVQVIFKDSYEALTLKGERNSFVCNHLAKLVRSDLDLKGLVGFQLHHADSSVASGSLICSHKSMKADHSWQRASAWL